VASEFGGIRNVIETGRNGLLVDPSNTIEFAEAMTALLNDEVLSKGLGAEGHQTIHKFFSWEAIAKRHLEFYKKFMT
jgi:glycosyltransferase involved in cell wall biosynthesis